MRRFRLAGLRFALFGIVWVAVMGLAIFGLWNALMPSLFGLPSLGFWQALGLLLLSRLLLGGWGRGFFRKHGAHYVRGWKNLTPEQRQHFRRAMKSYGPQGFNDSETTNKI